MNKVLRNYEELARKKFTPINIIRGDSIAFTWTPDGTPEQMSEFRKKYGPPTAVDGKGYVLNKVTLEEDSKYTHMSINEAVIFGAEFEDRLSLGCIAMDGSKVQ